MPEKFDNISGTANALYVNMAAAINSGSNQLRGPSNIIVATAGTATAAPTLATTALAGGTDGSTPGTGTSPPPLSLAATRFLPEPACMPLAAKDVPPLCSRTRMTALSTPTQNAFGLTQGAYMFVPTPSGDVATNAISNKAAAGIDGYGIKIVFGDWCLWYDTANGISRFVSPAAFLAGLRVALSPEQSLLNKQLQGIQGTQKTASGQNYTSADIQAFELAGIDVIANPSPGGTYFAAQTGHNASSNALTHGDNYTSLTNYITLTLNKAAGPFVGKTNTPTLQAQFKATCDTFLLNMQDAGQISAFQVICDSTNNSPSQEALGYLTASIQVVYFSMVEVILLNIQGGDVTITPVSTFL